MTKRKVVETQAWKSKPKKRVAFSAPKTAATRTIITRNATDSPLLQLPVEIRSKVWTEVLGDRLIHLDYYYDNELSFEDNEQLRAPWRHIVCERDCPEDQPDEKVVFALDGEEPERVHWFRPHERCNIQYDEPDPDLPIDFWDHETMRLTVLRACRQIYVEANQILWTTNTFSCIDATTFKRFMMTRTIGQKRLIRTLRLEMERENQESFARWSSSLNMALVNSLSGLRTLRLCITHDMPTELYRHVKTTYIEGYMHCEGLRRLSTLPLTSVEIVVKNSGHGSKAELDKLWTKNDRNEVAESLQGLLLKPKGAEVYAEDQKRERERRQEERKYWAKMKASIDMTEPAPNQQENQQSQLENGDSTPLRTLCAELHEKVTSFLQEDVKTERLTATQQQTRRSLAAIQEALDKYELSSLSLSYNGGKDCLVLLILYLSLLSTHTHLPPLLPSIYIPPLNPFPSVDAFVASSSATYHLSLHRYPHPSMRLAFSSYLTDNPHIKAIFVGTRRTDPHGADLTFFDETDRGWPKFMRVHPVIDWHYAEVWAFLRHLGVEYCALYDEGYTSLGGVGDTHPNPALRVEGGERFRPAYELEEDEEERLGRD